MRIRQNIDYAIGAPYSEFVRGTPPGGAADALHIHHPCPVLDRP